MCSSAEVDVRAYVCVYTRWQCVGVEELAGVDKYVHAGGVTTDSERESQGGCARSEPRVEVAFRRTAASAGRSKNNALQSRKTIIFSLVYKRSRLTYPRSFFSLYLYLFLFLFFFSNFLQLFPLFLLVIWLSSSVLWIFLKLPGVQF